MGHVAALVRSQMNGLLPFEMYNSTNNRNSAPSPKTFNSCYNDKTIIAAYDRCYTSRAKGRELYVQEVTKRVESGTPKVVRMGRNKE